MYLQIKKKFKNIIKTNINNRKASNNANNIFESSHKKISKTNCQTNNKQQIHNSICSYQTSYNINNTKDKNKKVSIDKVSIFNEFNNFNKIQKEKSDANKSSERTKNSKKFLVKSSSATNLKETKITSKISDSTSLGLSIKNGTISSGSNLHCGTDSKKFIKFLKFNFFTFFYFLIFFSINVQ